MSVVGSQAEAAACDLGHCAQTSRAD